MPRGGKRAGAGRKPGSMSKRHRVVVEDSTGLMPVEWMLAVLRDPQSEQHRRDRMAEIAAPYLHPRLNAVAVNSITGGDSRDNGDTNVLQIYSVPKGGKIEKDGTITIEGAVVELSPIEPFTGTPALTDQREYKRVEPDPVPFEVTEIDPPQNVTVLNPHGRRQHDNDTDDGGPGAA